MPGIIFLVLVLLLSRISSDAPYIQWLNVEYAAVFYLFLSFGYEIHWARNNFEVKGSIAKIVLLAIGMYLVNVFILFAGCVLVAAVLYAPFGSRPF